MIHSNGAHVPPVSCHDEGGCFGRFSEFALSRGFMWHVCGLSTPVQQDRHQFDLAFWWTDSPAFYWIAGGAIHTIHNSRLGFDTLNYCDIVTKVDVKVGSVFATKEP